MDPARAAQLVEDWVGRHETVEPPSLDAVEAITGALALVPAPDAAAAITGVDGRPRLAAVAGGALSLVWAVRSSASVCGAARCRRTPLDADVTVVEVSE
ncbi:MAG: hypothetical protein ACR2L8_02465, partial [Solirubrobacteraceae bacterium]